MVGLGLAMLLLGVWGAYQRWRGKLYQTRLFLLFAFCMGPTGLIAVLAGWITTEVGRQPWVVYGILRTQDAVSNHSVLTLSITLVMFIVMYFLIFGTGIGFMLRMVAVGPDEGRGSTRPQDDGQIRRPARPLSAAPDKIDPALLRETTEV
ncbi:Cytochrome bd-II ubiquinol oxidase subunit 1 [compost metagenome]